MNKKKTILKYFQKIMDLSLGNKEYTSIVDELILWLLRNDKVNKDLTTKFLQIQKSETAKAIIFARKDLVIAGIEEAAYLLKNHTGLKFRVFHKDGELIKTGESILELQGSTSEILSYERVLLNILQRLTGIATETKTLTKKIEKLKNRPFIAATRKTNWGLLDKKAVALGGGLTHRLSLSDGILVKDNHLLWLQKKFNLSTEKEMVVKALGIFLKNVKDTLIEIEVEREESIPALIEAFNASATGNVLGILLDNFSPKHAKKVLTDVKQKYDVSSVVFEASGGITKKNISEWADTGVDVISLGALTHSAKAADISLDLL